MSLLFIFSFRQINKVKRRLEDLNMIDVFISVIILLLWWDKWWQDQFPFHNRKQAVNLLNCIQKDYSPQLIYTKIGKYNIDHQNKFHGYHIPLLSLFFLIIIYMIGSMNFAWLLIIIIFLIIFSLYRKEDIVTWIVKN